MLLKGLLWKEMLAMHVNAKKRPGEPRFNLG